SGQLEDVNWGRQTFQRAVLRSLQKAASDLCFVKFRDDGTGLLWKAKRQFFSPSPKINAVVVRACRRQPRFGEIFRIGRFCCHVKQAALEGSFCDPQARR
ncbi:hypothetical protein, partial [Bradyrhizobium sp. Bra64]|uniref:hypothetical protein n=1 Tax=Bradyrhizobium sp. Bra64 TaxID=2926009 RepID=UPI0021175989